MRDLYILLSIPTALRSHVSSTQKNSWKKNSHGKETKLSSRKQGQFYVKHLFVILNKIQH